MGSKTRSLGQILIDTRGIIHGQIFMKLYQNVFLVELLVVNKTGSHMIENKVTRSNLVQNHIMVMICQVMFKISHDVPLGEIKTT